MTIDEQSESTWSSIMGMITSTFCDVRNGNLNDTFVSDMDERASIEKLQNVTSYILTAMCIFGVAGNILNLRTLQSSSLQTVPFMYIRTLAVFDLIGLVGVLINIISKAHFGSSYWIIAYKSHIEPVLINTFFNGGLYCAFMLTMERSMLIARPHYRQKKPRRAARIRIFIALITALILHVPLGLQFIPVLSINGGYTIGNNVNLLCDEPMKTFFHYYKLIREGIRLATVLLMAFLNGVIAYKLQQTKKRRREMLCQRATTAAMLCSTASASARSSIAMTDARSVTCNYSTTGGAHGNNPSFSSASSSGGRQPRPRVEEQRTNMTSLHRSFAEKKLTVLMAVICFIFILGNLPQMIIMSVQDETKEGVWRFQVLRQIGNCTEVLNHCANFYLFCLASSEYYRAFFKSCSCLQSLAARVPFFKRFVQGPFLTGTSMVSMNAPREMVTGIELGDLSNSSGGRKISTIPNEAALSASQEDNLRKVSSEPGTSNGAGSSSGPSTSQIRESDEEERKPLRGILINSGRRLSCSLRSSGIRQKRSLTIANEAETSMMIDVDDEGIEKVEASV